MIPEFYRGPLWTGSEARAAWEPEVRKASALWTVLERASVEHGIRPSCLLSVRHDELPTLDRWANLARLEVALLGPIKLPGSYAAGNAVTGEAGLRVAVYDPMRAGDWRDAFDRSDDSKIGELLGFPECCRSFFMETWAKGARDTTIQMLEGGDAPAVSNIMLRWLGIRLVPHLPCAWTCEPSVRMANQMYDLAKKLGLHEQADAALRILAWPMEYSTLHGVCEVVTPVLKFMASSDYYPTKRVVKRDGVFNPIEAPKVEEKPEPRDTWSINGFKSKEAMDSVHQVVAAVVNRGRCTFCRTSIIDLGCGDGSLLEAISPDVTPAGVDINPQAPQQAFDRFGRGQFWQSDVSKAFDSGETYEFALLMPGRLLEMNQDVRWPFMEKLVKSVTTGIVIYAYSDWLAKYGSLAEMCKRAGLIGEFAEHEVGDGVEAALIKHRGEYHIDGGGKCAHLQ